MAESGHKPRPMIRTRAGYIAAWAGIVVIVLGLGAIWLSGLWGTFFGVLTIGTLFFVGIALPYIIDNVSEAIQKRRAQNEKPDK